MTIITKRFCCLLVGLAIWFAPAPVGLVPQAWHLFAIFAAVIFAVIIGAMPIVLASVVGLVASIMSGALDTVRTFLVLQSAITVTYSKKRTQRRGGAETQRGEM